MSSMDRKHMVCLDDFEKYARDTLSRPNFDYITCGAGQNITYASNRQAFSRYKILPRVLRDVTSRDLTTTILGQTVSMPIGIAPTAAHTLAHHDGELATASAAENMGVIYTVATLATKTMEEIAENSPKCPRFLQLYFPEDNGYDVVRDLVRRAEKHGYSALVLTVDRPVHGHFYDNMRNNFVLHQHAELRNIHRSYEALGVSEVNYRGNYGMQLMASNTWRDVTWIKSITKLPIVIKGILCARDAELACEHGAAAVWVSNHGGRTLDTVPATIDMLGAVVEAVGQRCEVYMDGGVRHGTDVYKALAIGARAVFIGRPVMYGLAYDGERGVRQVLQILQDELSSTMALSGCTSLADITQEMLIQEPTIKNKL